jgi:hypothetical protein
MKILFRSRLILTLAALVMIVAVAVPLVFSAGQVHASPAQRNASSSGNPSNSPFYAVRPNGSGHTALHLSNSSISLPIGHFLYVDDGSCPDLIDVYRTTASGLVHIGAFFSGGCGSSTLFGTQDMAVTPANGAHLVPCLVYTDLFHGLVESFPINANGSLGSRVSHLANFDPIDVHISSDGNLVYVDSRPSSGSILSSYSLGTACALTALTTLSTTHFYVSFALASLSDLVTVDSKTGTIDTYALTPIGGISLLNSVPGQIGVNFSSAPDSVAVQTTGGPDVFTGQASLSRPEAQGGQENLVTGAISFLTGSPASDTNPFSKNGAATLFDNSDALLVQGEQYSNSLAVYSVTAGNMAFKEETHLNPFGGGEPSAFAQLSNVLFVNTDFFGDVEACNLSSAGASGCVTVAILTNPYGIEAGIVAL